WGCHDQPWLLIWGKNQKPELDEHFFHLLTPIRENALSNRGRFRLDYQSAYQISAKQLIQTSWLCKALAIGSILDVNVMEKMTKAAAKQSIGSFWNEHNLKSVRGVDTISFKNKEAPAWLLDLELFDGPSEVGLFGTT